MCCAKASRLSNRLRIALRMATVLAAVAAIAFWLYEFTESPRSQIFGKTLVSGPANERVVALTYDDGPNPPYTNAILNVLEKEHVHATFFLVGRAVAAYPALVRREALDGDAIGNHTWNHAHLIVMSSAQVRESLDRTQRAIYAASGVTTHIMRPPFGARDWQVLDEIRKLGYTPVMWSVPLAKDWQYPPARVIAQRILPHVHDGSIIVLHDGNRGMLCGPRHLPAHLCDRSSDIKATQIIVSTLKREGYRFVTVPQLLALKRATHTSALGSE
jgi:peptidoglycan/xylan/chitin deacetylase (PgdA/CDA1 family)